METKVFAISLILCLAFTAVCERPEQLDYSNPPYSNGAMSKHCRQKCQIGQTCVIEHIPGQQGVVAICTTICGDGLIVDEECDDGNLIDEDGCSNCYISPLYRCEGVPSVCEETCGNQGFQPDYMEQCDDGNNVSGDGCSQNCVLETDWNCENTVGEDTVCSKCGDGVIQSIQGQTCDSGQTSDPGCLQCQIQNLYSCSQEPSVCTFTCGVNGLQTEFGEICDDNNLVDGDGCSSTCSIEQDYTCVEDSEGVSDCYKCGDGIIDALYDEQCDTGATASEGCVGCMIADLYRCEQEPSVCTFTCGNNGLETSTGEICDDNNLDNGDGCSDTCTIEDGFTCVGEVSDCYKCGDGIVDLLYGEECDSGENVVAGCSNCIIEPLYDCEGEPSNCVFTCGINGIQDDEACDDGNAVSGDGCSDVCQIEDGYCCETVNSVSVCTMNVCGDGVVGGAEECDSTLYCDDQCQKINTGAFTCNVVVTASVTSQTTDCGVKCTTSTSPNTYSDFLSNIKVNHTNFLQPYDKAAKDVQYGSGVLRSFFTKNGFAIDYDSDWTLYDLLIELFAKYSVYTADSTGVYYLITLSSSLTTVERSMWNSLSGNQFSTQIAFQSISPFCFVAFRNSYTGDF